MLSRCVGACVLAVLFVPVPVRAQAYSVPTPAPTVSAVGHDWFDNRLPVLFAGDRYEPAGPRYHFDADIMIPAGSFDGVPIYIDTSAQPYSQILIPAGGGLVQPYERRRSGELAGTTGSHAPEFPVDILPYESAPADQAWTPRPAPAPYPSRAEERDVQGERRWSAEDEQARRQLLQMPGHIETVREPEGNRGIWIRYEDTLWVIGGKALPFDAGRFSKIGEYHGFPVFAARGGEEIFIPAVSGMVAVYKKDR